MHAIRNRTNFINVVKLHFAALIGLMIVAAMFGDVQAADPGDLDTGFGSGGLTFTDIGTATGDKAYSVAIQTDGKIVVAGASKNGVDDDFAVGRYTILGSVDNTFG